MYKEHLKTITLLILVITSCVLTYKTWSYQPEFRKVNTTLTTVPSTAQGEPVEFSNTMRTFQIIRVKDDETFGTMDQGTLVGMRQFLEGSKINLSGRVKKINNLKLTPSDTNAENFMIVDYLSDLPARSLFNILGFEIGPEMTEYNFDRVLIDLNRDYVVFNLLNGERTNYVAYETNVKTSDLRSVLDKNMKTFEDYSAIITNDRTSSRITAIYGPSAPGRKKVQQFIPSTISVNALNESLFLDEKVTTRKEDNFTIYESESGLATYSSKTYGYSYTNLKETRDNERSPHRTIEKSFTFLNGHMGLSSRYLLFSYDIDREEVTYRQTLDDYIVFSDEIATEIRIAAGKSTVVEYDRPMIQTNAVLPTDESIRLADIELVRYEIASNPQLDLTKVSKLIVAYDMHFTKDQTELNTIEYTPAWYVLYDGEWRKFEGGDMN
ncbi:YycH family regulatory protein [Phocicoccus pinnipedialis]|uniref:YycH protein n=1 Tax=Phocicoccus pinnipedialis TaxID=110845 RepID=A0A6V7R4L0_9BACL|nr:two-component system activity regulator YycH [Jeotgalicoccus pinnipedialis]MBP1939745.1 regulatory protein YycH of two-component signal transduction system YycFG [Jeotgalicoccus pinnipedialis]CAD2072367.1 YycH protein [Jeotgalicoccus pinnipedialis]